MSGRVDADGTPETADPILGILEEVFDATSGPGVHFDVQGAKGLLAKVSSQFAERDRKPMLRAAMVEVAAMYVLAIAELDS